jgi:dsRNA-specific ribonuclease
VLHFAVTQYIYAKYPLLSPGALSEYRSSLVNNKFLSVVCGALGIHKCISLRLISRYKS